MKIPELPTNPISFSPSHLGKLGLALGSISLGQWALSDVAHIPGGGLGIVALGAGAWWLMKPAKNVFDSPSTTQGWINLCNETLEQFNSLEDGEKALENKEHRRQLFENILRRSNNQNLAFIGSCGPDSPEKDNLQFAFRNFENIDFSWLASLPKSDENWYLPEDLAQKDLLIYMLPLPLRASDLLWLEKISNQQPSWLMVSWLEDSTWEDQLNELNAQLPDRWRNKILRFSDKKQDLSSLLKPVLKALKNSHQNIEHTTQRLLARLYSSWQSELEKIRRQKFRDIQQRTQWVVAGAVFASPVPSTDLMSIAVVNGLMIQEMANIWSCSWKPDVLQVVARQLVGAAIAQGIVEWSGQALLGVAKLHGSSWIAAGALQAISAAYLTRVVGRSMADWMALNNGVHECDLEELKKQAPEIVAKAAQEEKLNWGLFLKQAAKWTDQIQLNKNSLKSA